MSWPSEVVILAEDVRHQQSARRFLKCLGYENESMRMCALPSGRGCGEQWVREEYSDEVQACRRRNSKAGAALIVVIDADTGLVRYRSDALASALKERQIPHREVDEPISHLIPKRNIETWILCLNGQRVNEVDDYKYSKIESTAILNAAKQFFFRSRPNAVSDHVSIASLDAALPEARRIPSR